MAVTRHRWARASLSPELKGVGGARGVPSYVAVRVLPRWSRHERAGRQYSSASVSPESFFLKIVDHVFAPSRS
jgi:hypothetical protein